MTDRSQPFTQSARNALQRANEISQHRNQSAITPEHVLLGLIQIQDSHALTVLAGLNVDLKLITDRLETYLGPTQSFTTAPHQILIDTGGSLSEDTKAALTESVYEARESGASSVDGRLLLLGILRRPSTIAAQILREQNVTLERARGVAAPSADLAQPQPLAPPTLSDLPRTISPIFLGLVALTALAAILTYMGGDLARFTLFVFVAGGWMISLSLHEFGHALVAFLGGDRSVVDKGYLTLDPFKYTHKWLSIVFPLLLLAMGGIGLPGGAVYINVGAIRSRWMRSLTSAAGPFATGVCALALIVPFFLRLVGRTPAHIEFWAGMALLAFLQISALFFNLLPFPGLDGFGIIEPFLPQALLGLTYTIRRFTFFIIFLLFFNDTPVSQFFFTLLGVAIFVAGINPNLISIGLDLFRFWTG